MAGVTIRSWLLDVFSVACWTSRHCSEVWDKSGVVREGVDLGAVNVWKVFKAR